MLIPDDDEPLEVSLKQFRPLAPDPLQIKWAGYTPPRSFVPTAWPVAASAVLIFIFGIFAPLAFDFRASRSHSAKEMGRVQGIEQLIITKPLTIGGANALIATPSSFKTAVDEMAFQPQATPLSKGTHSALAVLSEEKTKL